jgi:glucose uptake protein
MIVPATYTIALLLAILAMVCWGSWASTYKLAGKWRFELYYYDFSLGVLLVAVAAAFTLGSLGNELSFSDNFLIAGKLKMAVGLGSGLLVNLAAILLLAAVSVAGMSVAFPLSYSVALAVSVGWNAFAMHPRNMATGISGVVLVAIAAVLGSLAWGADAPHRKLVFVDAPPPAGRVVPYVRRVRPTGTRGIMLSVFSGLLMGAFFPLASWTQTGDNGLGPYSLMVLLAAGLFVSTFVYNVYFVNLPVQGPALGMMEYFRGTKKQHALGLAGGVLWSAGVLAYLVIASVPVRVQPGRAGYALLWMAPLLSALWGLFAWKELQDSTPRVRWLVAAMLVFLAGGVALASWAAPR